MSKNKMNRAHFDYYFNRVNIGLSLLRGVSNENFLGEHDKVEIHKLIDAIHILTTELNERISEDEKEDGE